jgi:GGDEF domain-containing protein
MGAAFMPKDGTTFGELYKHADEALYTTKRNGRDGFSIYHEAEEKEV